ncbi:MAG: glycosyltransferase family 4 protein [Candidatus Margulisbacteria bacterium]|nr:glycosyltransferase family 4 protein [Candidatus Margulisiibacteriota bacterium]
MRILILSEAFPPETKSASTLFFELAESLAKGGHQVSVLTRMPRYNVAAGTNVKALPEKEIMSGVTVYRFQTPPLARDIPFIRGFEHFLLGWLFFFGGLGLGEFDLILVYSPPLPLGVAGYWLGRIKSCPVVVNIQDLYPQTVIDLGLLRNRFLIWVSRKMEHFIYKNSDTLTVHSEGNKQYLIRSGAEPNKVAVVDNWVDTELIRPGDKNNDFSRKYCLADKYVVSFAGVIGFGQGLEVVIEMAARLKEYQDILFVIVGDGVKKGELEAQAKAQGGKNVLFVPTQPRDIYPQILHASDVCLVVLDKTLVTPVVPGKTLSIMAAGKPVLASLPLSGDTPKILSANNCGLAVEGGRADLLAEALLKLYNNKPLAVEMGKNGRAAALKNFSRSICVDKYDSLFKSLMIGRK